MIRILLRSADGQVFSDQLEQPGAAGLEKYFARKIAELGTPVVLWIDLESPDSETLQWLGLQFGFHPLAIEDCALFDQRSKVESYEDHEFIVLNGFRWAKNHLSVYELHAFVSPTYLVTVHRHPIAPLTEWQARIQAHPKLFPQRSEFILQKCMADVLHANFEPLGHLESEADALELQVARQLNPKQLERNQGLVRQTLRARKVLRPQVGLFTALYERTDCLLSEEAKPYFRDLGNQVQAQLEKNEEVNGRLLAARDSYLALSALRTNDTMRRLTVFSAIFLPLTFITGFFGMNFTHLPFNHWPTMAATVGLVLGLPVVMLLYFKRMRWWD